LERWWALLEKKAGDPLTALQRVLRQRAANATTEEIELGCPLNNLAQEMSPLDDRFRRRINATFDTWREGFTRALERGQAEGAVRRDEKAKRVASVVVAASEGTLGVAKSAKSLPMMRSNLEVLVGFLDSLRSPSRQRRAQSQSSSRAR